MSENPISRPSEKYIVGNVSATIWENTVKVQGVDQIIPKVNLEKSYKDGDGNWQNTTSLDLADLPKARLALLKAYEHLAVKTLEDVKKE